MMRGPFSSGLAGMVRSTMGQARAEPVLHSKVRQAGMVPAQHSSVWEVMRDRMRLGRARQAGLELVRPGNNRSGSTWKGWYGRFHAWCVNDQTRTRLWHGKMSLEFQQDKSVMGSER